VIVRKERPHPGAQLRFTDIGGHRVTAFATDTKAGQLADLELRHRRRARCEDRIRCAKDTSLRGLPLHGFAQTRSGASWWPWPANCWPGWRCSPWTAQPGPRNPNGCGSACSAPPGASSAAAAPCGSASPPAGPGPGRSPPRSPACRPSPPADQHPTAPTTRKDNPRARGTPHTRRDSRATAL
jgi:hypothetical protein